MGKHPQTPNQKTAKQQPTNTDQGNPVPNWLFQFMPKPTINPFAEVTRHSAWQLAPTQANRSGLVAVGTHSRETPTAGTHNKPNNNNTQHQNNKNPQGEVSSQQEGLSVHNNNNNNNNRRQQQQQQQPTDCKTTTCHPLFQCRCRCHRAIVPSWRG